MLISKTIFKEYTRCARICALDELYKKKIIALPFAKDNDLAIELLDSMFNEEGDDLIDINGEEIEALLPYYNKYEKHAIEIAERIIGKPIIHSLYTKLQKSFSYNTNEHTYITYLDGYLEGEKNISIFEVKSTTASTALNFGYTKDKVRWPLFVRDGNFLRVREVGESDDKKKYANVYEKLFNRYDGFGKYVFDLAVEKYIIDNSIKGLGEYATKEFKYYLVILNPDYTYDGSVDSNKDYVYKTDKEGNELIYLVDLTKVVCEYQDKIKAMDEELIQNLKNMDSRKVRVGEFCEYKSKHGCPFAKGVCFEEFLQSGSILEYFRNDKLSDERGIKHSKFDCINSGLVKLDSIPEAWLSTINRKIQRECFVKGIDYINKDRIIEAYRGLKYPLYHLDFESFHQPLPRFRGEHPYTQSVFQFSLHIEKAPGVCDLVKDHVEYLAKDHSDNRLSLIQKMVGAIDLSDGGTVIVYNENFEKTRLKELAECFPEHAKELLAIRDHIFDLERLLIGESGKPINFYDNRLHGSFSIKKVLPIFAPELSYDNLSGVHNGVEAITAYAKYDKLEADDLKELQDNLVKYCRQDTYAMFVCLKGILGKVGINL